MTLFLSPGIFSHVLFFSYPVAVTDFLFFFSFQEKLNNLIFSFVKL